MRNISLGLDIGSTTIKVVAMEGTDILYTDYVRHGYHVPETLLDVLVRAREKVGEDVSLTMTGMGAINLASELGIPFVQELSAEGKAIRSLHGAVDVAVELGGEDAKLTFFDPAGEDRRMNRLCAGGTGAFLEHLAAFLGTDMAGLDRLASKGRPIYAIASRCGVFAKTDVQVLLNQGAQKEDIACSVFQAVVNQVVSGLAKGRRIEGRVVFLGGPLTFLHELRKRFVETLALDAACARPLPYGVLHPALGAALSSAGNRVSLSALITSLQERKGGVEEGLLLPPLFASRAEYEDFRRYYGQYSLQKRADWPDVIWLGMDAGSTTMKLVAIDAAGRIVYERYQKNAAQILETGRAMLLDFYREKPAGVRVSGSAITGYGEDFLQQAFSFDMGEVETLAHLTAARHFCPDLTALLDIGGQDMKYIRLEEGAISDISLNGACAAGCGLFLETQAETLGLSLSEMVEMAISAKHTLDLGYRCTVLMNSRIHHLQNESLETGALIAGLCLSVVKSALYRVIHLQDVAEMGDRIVVEGGTFANDAVLRSLEILAGHRLIRPSEPGLMGAYGAALLAKERYAGSHVSSLLSKEKLASLDMEEEELRCGGCGNRCLLSRKTFSNGAVYVTGNRCSRGERFAGAKVSYAPDLAEWTKERILRPRRTEGKPRGIVGMVRALQFWSDFPFWQAFWTALGYRVQVSKFDASFLGKSAASVPAEIYCYPCKMAHAHLLELLSEKPDFIWMPVSDQGKEEPEIDQRTHSSYGDLLASSMKKELDEAGIPFYHPRVDTEKKAACLSWMRSAFPAISTEEIERAWKAAEAERSDFQKECRARTEDVLALIHREKKQAIVLVGRDYHLDPELNKGVAALAARLGVPVLTGEGLYLLHAPTVHPTQRACLLYAAERVAADPYLQLVHLQSTSCGYDGMTIQEARRKVEAAGKLYTILHLDQGVSAGALKIRLRSLMAEVEELSAHPGILRKHVSSDQKGIREITGNIAIEPAGYVYDQLLSAALTSAGYQVDTAKRDRGEQETLPAEADAVEDMPLRHTGGQPLVVLSSWQRRNQNTRASCVPLFLGMGRMHNEFPLSTELFHKVWPALFLGDLLLRCELALSPLEKEPGSLAIAMQEAKVLCLTAVQTGTFAAYEEAIAHVLARLDALPRKEKAGRAVGLLGDPWMILPCVGELTKMAGISWKMQGLGEWLLDVLTELYFIEGFAGDQEAALTCMSSRACAHTCLEILLQYVNQTPWLDPLETPEEKKTAINGLRDFPEKHLAEPSRDLLRRGAERILCIEKSGEKRRLLLEKLTRLAPAIPVMPMEIDGETLTTQERNRMWLFLD